MSLITGQGKCFLFKKHEPFQSCHGLILYPGMEIFLQKEAGSVPLDAKGLTNVVNNQPNKKYLPLTREKQFFLIEVGE